MKWTALAFSKNGALSNDSFVRRPGEGPDFGPDQPARYQQYPTIKRGRRGTSEAIAAELQKLETSLAQSSRI